MSRVASPAVLFLAGVCFLATSQPVLAAPGEDNGKRAEFKQKLLEKFDRDGDGKLGETEKAAAKEAKAKRDG